MDHGFTHALKLLVAFLFAMAIAAFAASLVFPVRECLMFQAACLAVSGIITAVVLQLAFGLHKPFNYSIGLLGIWLALTALLAVLGWGFGSRLVDAVAPAVKATFCPPEKCASLASAERLLDTGSSSDLAGAETLARQFAAAAPDAACKHQTEAVLARILIEEARMDTTNRACDRFARRLDEMEQLTRNWTDFPDVRRSIADLRSRGCQAATPPTAVPTVAGPAQLELLRQRRVGNEIEIDLRVFRNGQAVTGLQASDFSAVPPISFVAERRESDPICLIAVVDNSPSIVPNLGDIRNAVTLINSLRKPNDEVGMVLFGGADTVRVVAAPGPGQIPAQAVDGASPGTAIWDAMLTGLTAAQSCASQDKYLAVITDGDDNNSRRVPGATNVDKARTIAALARAQSTNICTIGIQSPDLQIDQLRTASTGCRAQLASDPAALAGEIRSLFGQLGPFYRVRIPAGTATSVTIRALGSPDLVVPIGE